MLSVTSTHLLEELKYNASVFIVNSEGRMLCLDDRSKQLLYPITDFRTVSLVSLLSSWIISKNPKVIWITCFRCGRAASHVHSLRVTWSVAACGWPLLSALFQHFPSFGPDSPQHMLMVSCLSTTRFMACLEDLKLSAKL